MALPNLLLFKIKLKWSLLVVIISIIANYNAHSKQTCGQGIDSIGYTVPSGDIILQYGDPLEIICSLNERAENENAEKYNIANLKFRRGNEIMSDDYVDILNATSIRLRINNHPKTAKEEYYCVYKGITEEFVCLNYVVVGVFPQKVQDFRCLSYNYEKLFCNWTVPENYIVTHYNLSYSVTGSSAMFRHMCPSTLQIYNGKLNCTWSLSTNPQYRHAHDNLMFNLFIHNKFGHINQPFNISTWKFVIPNAPLNLTGEPTSPYSIKINWTNGMTFPVGTYHRIIYSNRYETEWQEAAYIRNALKNKTLEYTLTGLKYAYTLYDIRVLMRSAVADEDDESLWSNHSNIIIRTLSTIPDRPPKTNVGSFKVINKQSSRDVYVYWQNIKAEEENGQNLTYHVEIVNEPSRQPKENKKAYAKFENLLIGIPYTFHIWSQNEVGRSERKSIVNVPSDQERASSPINVMIISHTEQVYELKWARSNSTTVKPLTNYTVFWCISNRHHDRPYQCDGDLYWETVPSTTLSFHKNYTIPNHPTEQFAVSANTIYGSSGMSWAECTLWSENIGKLTNVFVKRTGTSWISIGWSLSCSDKIPSVTGYEIIYCELDSKMNCKGEQMFRQFIDDPKSDSANITGLEPYETYKIQIGPKIDLQTPVSQYSDPLYDHTLEGAPPQPSNIKITNITSNSLNVSWDKPTLNNLYIKYSKVRFNGNETEVDREKTSYILKDLIGFTNYTIQVISCAVQCSPPSEKFTIQTVMSEPSKIEPSPAVTQKADTNITITWNRPNPPNGHIDYYELKFNDQIIKIIGRENYLFANCDRKVRISVRAVNIKNDTPLFGDWSDELQYDCTGNINIKLYVIIGVAIFIFAISVYCGPKGYKKFKSMKNFDPKLPPGLDGAMSKYFDEKLPAEETDPPSQSVKLLDVATDNSSGCSSGQESIASSHQSTSHLSSSDSGTEHHDRTPTSSIKLRKRNSGMSVDSPQTLRSAITQPGPYVVFGGETTKNDSGGSSAPMQLGNLGKLSGDSSSYVISGDIVKPPNPGYVPFTTQEPALKNTEYVVAGIPTSKMLMPELLHSRNNEKQPSYVQAAPMLDSLNKNIQLPRQYAPTNTADMSNLGYVCVGDAVAPPKIDVDCSGTRGYVPHKQFEIKSIKED